MTEDEPTSDRVVDDIDALRHRLRAAAHDVRSLLGPIAGFAELIATADDVEQCRAYAGRITQASVRLQALADGLIERILEDTDPPS